MIFGGIANGFKNLFTFNQPQKFIIYDAEVLNAQNRSEYQQYVLLSFDALNNSGYNNNVNIPTQTLENRQFSNDSIIDNPFELNVTCSISQGVVTNSDITADKEGVTSQQLNYILKSNVLLVIFRGKPLIQTYTNMHLLDWSYVQDPNNTALNAQLIFREIRTTYVPNNLINTQNNPTYNNGSFVPSQSNNPSANTPVDNGFVTPSNPTGNVNSLNSNTSQFGNL